MRVTAKRRCGTALGAAPRPTPDAKHTQLSPQTRECKNPTPSGVQCLPSFLRLWLDVELDLDLDLDLEAVPPFGYILERFEA